MLHITNGDSAAEIIRATDLPGTVLPWRDPMHHGPFPEELSFSALSRVRARYLADDASAFEARDACLSSAAEHDEVVLWFEHDLLDQLQLLQLLDWFHIHSPERTRLSLVCIDQFPGIEGFKGLGQLNALQMQALFPGRQDVSHAQRELAHAVWGLYRKPDPMELHHFVRCGSDELPFLRTALHRHFEEFPWLSDGLTRTERQLMQVIADGETQRDRVFVKNMENETVLYIGDLKTYSTLDQLASGDAPLIVNGDALSLTDIGRDLIAGATPTRRQRTRDYWLGGVHLSTSGVFWAWDDTRQHLETVGA